MEVDEQPQKKHRFFAAFLSSLYLLSLESDKNNDKKNKVFFSSVLKHEILSKRNFYEYTLRQHNIIYLSFLSREGVDKRLDFLARGHVP